MNAVAVWPEGKEFRAPLSGRLSRKANFMLFTSIPMGGVRHRKDYAAVDNPVFSLHPAKVKPVNCRHWRILAVIIGLELAPAAGRKSVLNVFLPTCKPPVMYKKRRNAEQSRGNEHFTWFQTVAAVRSYGIRLLLCLRASRHAMTRQKARRQQAGFRETIKFHLHCICARTIIPVIPNRTYY